jgi:hypothetical protein
MAGASMIALGIDPGKQGAAVILLVEDGRSRVVRAVAWCPRPAGGFRLRRDSEDEGRREWEIRDWTWHPQCVVGELTKGLAVDLAAVEGIFAVGDHVNGIVLLAEHAGAMVAEARRHVEAVHRPLARDWRPRQLGLSVRTPADRCEEMAITRAGQIGMVPTLWRAGYTLTEWGAICEAAWIARDAVTMGQRGSKWQA